MSDSYQAIYDATRSKVSNGDIGDAVYRAIHESFDSSFLYNISQEYINAAMEQQRPCVIFKPSIYIDMKHWCALYGENLQDGVAGFGESPAEAMLDFDKNWFMKLGNDEVKL